MYVKNIRYHFEFIFRNLTSEIIFLPAYNLLKIGVFFSNFLCLIKKKSTSVVVMPLVHWMHSDKQGVERSK